jgi:uncharacterized protein (TIGR03083 family)
MTTLVDRTIAALRTNYDDLAARVGTFTDADLDRPSGATEWDVAQVLGHLGGASEIGLAALLSAVVGEDVPGEEFNRMVWDRWDAMTPRGKADGFVVAAGLLVSAYEELDAQQRGELNVRLGFLPFPADVTLLSGMRLNEFAMHSWDVRVAFDPSSTLSAEEADVLLAQRLGPMAFLTGFAGKSAPLDGRHVTVRVELTEPSDVLGLIIEDVVSTSGAPAQFNAVLSMTTEAFLRLMSGRLRPEHTPPGSAVAGESISLEDLRAIFPGF